MMANIAKSICIFILLTSPLHAMNKDDCNKMMPILDDGDMPNDGCYQIGNLGERFVQIENKVITYWVAKERILEKCFSEPDLCKLGSFTLERRRDLSTFVV